MILRGTTGTELTALFAVNKQYNHRMFEVRYAVTNGAAIYAARAVTQLGNLATLRRRDAV